MSLEYIRLETKRRFFSKRIGEHTSAYSGSGVAFKDLVAYDSSQSVRHINWKKSTKTAIVANSYYDDRQLNVALIYLNSGSLAYKNKQQKALEALTALTTVAIEQKEALTTLFFNSKESKFLPPTKRRDTITRNYNLAKKCNYQGEIETSRLTSEVLHKVQKRSLLFFIGDFLEPIDFSYLSRLYEIYAIVIRDRSEEELDLSGELNIVDLNSQKKEFITVNRRSQKVYNKLFKEYDRELIEGFRANRVEFIKVYTSDNTVAKLVELTRWKR